MKSSRIQIVFKKDTPNHVKSTINKICNTNQVYIKEQILAH